MKPVVDYRKVAMEDDPPAKTIPLAIGEFVSQGLDWYLAGLPGRLLIKRFIEPEFFKNDKSS